MAIKNFNSQFAHFEHLIAVNDKGHAFTNFREGVAAAWEDYKPRLRQHALKLLELETWTQEMVGSGELLRRVIASIEIQNHSLNLRNNIVLWQNRYGHANREHRVFLEAKDDRQLRADCEDILFRLYKGRHADEGTVFEQLSNLTGGKYPLLGYLFFIKDKNRFMPIQPTTFDRAFRDLGIELQTVRNCSWSNYRQFNEALGEVQAKLASLPGLADARLVDAHSFCWLLARLDNNGSNVVSSRKRDLGRVLGARQKAVVAMRISILHTAANSNGQIVEKVVKNKETNLNPLQLDDLLAHLLDRQEDRCALTGIPFRFGDARGDNALLPSPDRIDSNGHYTIDNLQVVCRFVNAWKGATLNEEFKRLLMLVRGVEEAH